MTDDLLRDQVSSLAAQGFSPYEIEEQLGMEHYTIHIHHHADLMVGYRAYLAKKSARAKAAELPKTPEEIEERRRQYQREYWKNNKRRLRERKRQLRNERRLKNPTH